MPLLKEDKSGARLFELSAAEKAARIEKKLEVHRKKRLREAVLFLASKLEHEADRNFVKRLLEE
jgi:hypothetical protein